MFMNPIKPTEPDFMFATGIENSIPMIQNGRVRVDEMESCGHYRHWRTDFELLAELGIDFLRYGPPLQRASSAPAATIGPSPTKPSRS
jgi:hypothetical protein